MMGENSTETVSNTTKALPNVYFFDPGWQLVRNVEFYYQYAVIAIGIFGAAANALVLYALIAHYMHDVKKRAINLLIISQNLLDVVCCILLVISYSMNVSRMYITGAFGYVLCAMILNDNAMYCALKGSIFNLIFLTIERAHTSF